jgi:hypothetical protein
MPELSLTYITKTKTHNGLKNELIKTYKKSFGIKSTTRFYNMDDYSYKLEFNIEHPSKGTGYIRYVNNGGEISTLLYYSPL